jgi:hypothetical protein
MPYFLNRLAVPTYSKESKNLNDSNILQYRSYYSAYTCRNKIVYSAENLHQTKSNTIVHMYIYTQYNAETVHIKIVYTCRTLMVLH